MVVPKFAGTPLAGTYPLVVNFINYSINANVYLWDFGDGYTSTEENPTHAYSDEGPFTVSLTATNIVLPESDTLVKNDYVQVFSSSFRLNSYLSNSEVSEEPYKISSNFLTIGWIKAPFYRDGEYVIPLAVEDRYGKMLDSDESVKFMLLKENGDYKFVYNNAQSQLIDQSSSIDLEDGNWHFLVWACSDGAGTMTFSVDGEDIPAREGVDLNGLLYSKAYSQKTRLGGGRVWSPYLYNSGQSIILFNWRFANGLVLPDSMMEELVRADKEYLDIL